MKRIFLGVWILWLAVGPALAGLNAYRAEHWILGSVPGAPDGTVVTLYREGTPAISVTGTVNNETYRINALALGWGLSDNIFGRWWPKQTLMAEIRDNGTGSVAPPVSLFSTGFGYEYMPDLVYTYDFLDISYGPQIRVEALFHALVDLNLGTHAQPVMVVVEARTLSDGTAPVGGAADATHIVGQAIAQLSETGNTIGRNGFIRPDGTPFGEATPMPDGTYYLVVKQRLTPTLVGIGHLPIISNAPVQLTTVVNNRDASTTAVDFTRNPDMAFKPADSLPDALDTITIGSVNRAVFRPGEMMMDGFIDYTDVNEWLRLNDRQVVKDEPEVPADPFIRADLDQNNTVDYTDLNWWFVSLNKLVIGEGQIGPHSYLPEYLTR